MTTQPRIVVTGCGMVSAAGVGLSAQTAALLTPVAKRSPDAYSLHDFDPRPHLSDRRLLKAVSRPDAVGLVALEELRRGAPPPEDGDPERLGLYVGAPPASVYDNEPYLESMRAAAGDGGVSAFGETFRAARPTTLLSGLPNNVLCYGAMLLDARGPNSNYTSGETSGQVAVINAARRIVRGRLERAVAGGFSAHADPVTLGMFRARGWLRPEGAEPVITPFNGGTLVAEGGVFLLLEPQAAAERRGAPVLVEYLGGGQASEATGLMAGVTTEPAMALAIRQALTVSGVSTAEIGLVMSSATGIPELDMAEQNALMTVFQCRGFGEDGPVLGTTARFWGNLLEAGGLGECAVLPDLYARGELPPWLRLGGGGRLDPKRRCALILRSSVFGDATCLLVRVPV